MSVTTAPGRGYILTILASVTTGTSDVACPSPATRYHTVTITANTAATGGSIQVESSDDPTFTGNWNAEGSAVTVSTTNQKSIVSITGKRVAVRARITSNITGAGGSVIVTYEGN